MPAKVSLPVAIKIQAPRHHPAGDGFFPDARAHHFALPRDIAWKTDIHRDNGIHLHPPAAKTAR
jgi:hypothetical protein